MLDRFMTALAAAAILSFALPAQTAMAQAAKTETAAVATAAAQDMPAEMRAWQARVEADAEAKKKAEAARKQAAARRAAKKAEQEAAAKAEAERIAAETEKLRKRYWWLPKTAIEAKLAEQEQKRAGEKKQVASKPAAKQAEKQTAKAEAEKPAQAPEAERKPIPFMFGLFDAPKPEPAVLNEEQAVHDATLASVPEKKRFRPKEEFVPTTVPFKGYKPGTIVIDTKSKYLYFVESPVSARRYGVAVGKEGLLFTGKATVGEKRPWPRWIPTKEMIARDPSKYGRYADGMDGGPKNPLGARAIYLYQGKQDTYLRIHGTNAPETIGTASSNGCFRMINEHVIDLYDRVQMGAEVVVL